VIEQKLKNINKLNIKTLTLTLVGMLIKTKDTVTTKQQTEMKEIKSRLFAFLKFLQLILNFLNIFKNNQQ